MSIIDGARVVRVALALNVVAGADEILALAQEVLDNKKEAENG